jgi:hypothetical protein
MRQGTCVVHSSSRRSGPCGNVLVLGYQGAVGQALLNVLADTQIGREIVGRIDNLALIDEGPSEEPSVSTRVRVLPPQRVQTRAGLCDLLAALGVDQLIDLSDLDPLECIYACAQTGVDCVLLRGAITQPAIASAATVVTGWMQLGRSAGLHFIDDVEDDSLEAARGSLSIE